jgi:hypothetical protein
MKMKISTLRQSGQKTDSAMPVEKFQEDNEKRRCLWQAPNEDHDVSSPATMLVVPSPRPCDKHCIQSFLISTVSAFMMPHH